jgi:hypothetical protein
MGKGIEARAKQGRTANQENYNNLLYLIISFIILKKYYLYK